MNDGDSHDDGGVAGSDERCTTTRRAVLALLGVGGFGAMTAERARSTGVAGSNTKDTKKNGRPWHRDVDANGHDLLNLGALDVRHVHTPARIPDVVVWKDDDGVFHADGHDGQVARGGDVLDVTQAAVDSLTEDRTWKETVMVVSPGTVPYNAGEFREIQLPSYTILDVAAPITCEYEPGEYSNVIVATSRDTTHVEIPRLTVKGGPWMATRFQRCSNIRLGDITILYAKDADTNDGIRIDNGYDIGTPSRSEDVQIDSVYLEDGGHHAVETYGVDRVQIDRVIAKDIGGCGVLLNQTSDATINSVIGRNPGGPAGYPTFRLANFCNNVSVGQIVSRGGMKGIMLLTARNASIGEVNIVGAEDSGIFVSLSFNVSISGGVIKNCNGEAIRVHGYPTDQFDYTLPTAGITISNVRMLDDRPKNERTQTHAIRETGPTAFSNQYVDNDVRKGGTVTPITVASESSTIAGNIGDGVASGTTTLSSDTSPAARIEGVSKHKGSTLRLREKAFEGPDAPFSWDQYFEWNPNNDAWDLLFEWRTDPGTDVTLDYIVDRPQANIDRRQFDDTWDDFAGMD